MRIDWRRSARILSIIIVFVALYFVADKIWSNRLWVYAKQFTRQILIIIFLGSILYALSGFLLSSAWRRLLLWFGHFNANVKETHAIYAYTQIAKYIPGNIFHIAGRHALGKQLGFGHGQLTGAAIYEVSGLLTASTALALAGTAFYGMNYMRLSVTNLLIIFISMLLLTLFSNKVITKLPKFKSLNMQEKKISEISTQLIPIYFLYLFFFVIAGVILCWVTNTVSHIDNLHQAGYVIMTLAVSWIVGFITPGASGGIGVREAIMIILLKNSHGESASLFIALIFRMITVLGDLLYFASSFALRERTTT